MQGLQWGSRILEEKESHLREPSFLTAYPTLIKSGRDVNHEVISLAQVLLGRLRSIGVVTDQGLQIGRLVDVVFDESDGKITSILVRPVSPDVLPSVPRAQDGTISVPFGAVMSIRDYIVVNERVLAIQRLRSSAQSPESPTE